VLDDLLEATWHRTERYANNRLEADHGRLKARLGPMRGLKQDRSASIVLAGHAFVQNLRRGHYELAVDEPVTGVWQWHSASWHWRSDALEEGKASACRPLTRCNRAW
jgi:DDE domain